MEVVVMFLNQHRKAAVRAVQTGLTYAAIFQLALGNVFGEHLAGFDAGLLRFSGAFGVSIGGLQSKAVMGSQDAPIEILIGIGSETFDARGLVDTVRFMAGVPLAF
jgi:hypothetical protein